jgi:hypothetical protein
MTRAEDLRGRAAGLAVDAAQRDRYALLIRRVDDVERDFTNQTIRVAEWPCAGRAPVDDRPVPVDYRNAFGRLFDGSR